MIIYLDAAYKNAKAIELLYQKYMLAQSFHAREYCKRIKEEYEKQIKTGFFYVDIKWKRENDDIQISSIERIRINANSHLIKIVGEAGSGKTTALQRLAYLDAKNYLKTGRGAIPIYISLKELEEDPTALPEINAMIARALNISQEDAEKMLSHGECTLLLDGYNEILTNRLKRQFATSIKNLTSKYDDISIILTDRAIMKNAIRVMSSAEKYCLYPLDREMKAEFIKLTCRDETARHILLSKMSHNPEYFDRFLTPMQLKHIIQLVSETKEITIDPEGDYIEFLFEREAEEKRDPNVDYLRTFAEYLAFYYENENCEEISIKTAEKIFGDMAIERGYTRPDSKDCIDLLTGMGILEREGNQLFFASPVYQEYFLNDYFNE